MSPIKKTEYVVMGEKTTICLITAMNGFEVVGVSSCVDPRDFDKDTGQRKAFADARSKLNQYTAYMRHYPDDLPF